VIPLNFEVLKHTQPNEKFKINQNSNYHRIGLIVKNNTSVNS